MFCWIMKSDLIESPPSLSNRSKISTLCRKDWHNLAVHIPFNFINKAFYALFNNFKRLKLWNKGEIFPNIILRNSCLVLIIYCLRRLMKKCSITLLTCSSRPISSMICIIEANGFRITAILIIKSFVYKIFVCIWRMFICVLIVF